MFMMLHAIFVVILTQWIVNQGLSGPLIYWLLGYFTASFLASGLVLLVVWLSRRKPRDTKPSLVVRAAKQVCGAEMSSAAGG